MKFLDKKNKQGFTLIETFVAISILLIAVMGPLQMFSKAIADGLYAKNQTIAYYLAQEGVELLLFNSYDTGDSIDFDNLMSDCSEGDPCTIYIDNNDDIEIGDSLSSHNLYFDADEGYNHQDKGTRTIFERKIYITRPVVGYDLLYQVHSSVTWSHFGLSRSFEINREFTIISNEGDD